MASKAEDMAKALDGRGWDEQARALRARGKVLEEMGRSGKTGLADLRAAVERADPKGAESAPAGWSDLFEARTKREEGAGWETGGRRYRRQGGKTIRIAKEKEKPAGKKKGPAPKKEKPTVEGALAAIEGMRTAGKFHPEHAADLAHHLMGLTIPQIQQVAQQHGQKATGKLKADRAKRAAEGILAEIRARAGEVPKEAPKEAPPPVPAPAPAPKAAPTGAALGRLADDPVGTMKKLHDEMRHGSFPYGGAKGLEKHLDGVMHELGALPLSTLKTMWHDGLGKATRLTGKDEHLKAIRQAMLTRAGAFDRAEVPDRERTAKDEARRLEMHRANLTDRLARGEYVAPEVLAQHIGAAPEAPKEAPAAGPDEGAVHDAFGRAYAEAEKR